MPLVDPAVSARKFERQLEAFYAQADVYRERGYFIVAEGDLSVDVAFIGHVPNGHPEWPLPIVAACIRFDYTNYDLWAPSITFIDVASGEPIAPHVGAFNFSDARGPDGRPPNGIIERHPALDRPFLCQPGVREYHEHEEHDGDEWLLYRGDHAGDLSVLCERMWQRMARNVYGLGFETKLLPSPYKGVATRVVVLQEDAAPVRAQLAAQEAAQRQAAQQQVAQQQVAQQRGTLAAPPPGAGAALPFPPVPGPAEGGRR